LTTPRHRPNIIFMDSPEISSLAALLSPLLEGVRFAYVFGSFGSPYFTAESDLDLAVDFGALLSPTEFFGLAESLSDACGRAVDLVDLRRADPIIAMQILRTGVVFLLNDRKALYDFQMAALSGYADHKLDRRPVEASLREAFGGKP